MLTDTQKSITHTPIYKPTQTNQWWDLEGFHHQEFFNTKRERTNLHGLLTHNQKVDSYQWVHHTPRIQHGFHDDGSPKLIPYDYRKLLTWYAPHLLYCLWYPYDGGKIIQIDRRALAFNRFRYRFMGINEFREYIWSQHKRAEAILHPDPESVIGKVFNNQWMTGEDIFPLRFSRHECQTFLPHFIQDNQCFYIPVSVAKQISQSNRESIQEIAITLSSFRFTISNPMNEITNEFRQRIGTSLKTDELQRILDELNYRPEVKKGRVTTLIRSLKQEGIVLQRKKVREGDSTHNVYIINEVFVEQLPEERLSLT